MPDYTGGENWLPSSDLISGDGSIASELNSDSGAGANYIANQTPFDVAENGQVTQSPAAGGGTTTTVNPPGWLSSLTSVFQMAGQAAPVVQALTGSTTTPATKVNTPGAGTPSGTAAASSSSKMLYIVLAIAAAALAVLFLHGKKG